MSCDKDGADITKERDLVKASQGNAVFGLVVIGNTAFISSWVNNKISSVFVSTEESNWTTEMIIPHSRELYSMVSTTSSIQTNYSHPCGQEDKGLCTDLCLPTKQNSYNCACPTFGGLALSFNAKNCESPSELLFFTLRGSGEVAFISIRGAQSFYLTLAGRSSEPSAVTYDPVKQVVYWSDVADEAIYFSSLAGKGDKQVFLNGSDGVGTVKAPSELLFFTLRGSGEGSSENLQEIQHTKKSHVVSLKDIIMFLLSKEKTNLLLSLKEKNTYSAPSLSAKASKRQRDVSKADQLGPLTHSVARLLCHAWLAPFIGAAVGLAAGCDECRRVGSPG
ncbi:hypothetical protein EGW08_010781 [Elysia chlorotica]|uniref:EGF-like domain-containing protein n=1 Tax=Elysia chlorotica TaxID=188477 RepID=A0A3S0ZMU1_ELYCH|nr:hypothetical protein EGW08_010781 [Elysia chlorotica]